MSGPPSGVSVAAIAAAGVALILAAAGCSDRPPKPWPGTPTTAARDSAPRPTTTAASLLADSAAGDSAALAGLPDQLREDLTVGPLLTTAALRDSARAYCQPISDTADPVIRKRLRGRWPDTLMVVLFVRADRASGALGRVELLRRTTDGQQRGYIWDEEANSTEAVEWLGGRSVTRVLPEGTPAPRALRGLGRRLLVLPCRGNAPTRD